MMHYDEYGDKGRPTILLLHGAGALDTFAAQYYLSERYRLIVPHLSGAGVNAGQVYEPKRTVEELLELVEGLGEERIGVIGHSLGAQLAVMLASRRPRLFDYAVFLSAWASPTERSIRGYCRLAGMSARLLHCKGIVRLQGRYWGFSPEQSKYMAEYSQKITAEVWRSFFENTLRLSELPEYMQVKLPMYAVCGRWETKEMRQSLELLGKNPHCRTLILKGAGHDYPMKNAKKLNGILEEILEKHALG